MNLLGAFRSWNSVRDSLTPWTGENDRLQRYNRYQRAYRGYSIRAPLGTSTVTQTRKLRFNLNKPIVNLGAQFLAAAPLDWAVIGNRDAQQACYDIWGRSGGDRTFLSAAKCAGINGDVVAVAAQDAQGKPRIEFVDPAICLPTFSGSDFSKLIALEIAFERLEFQDFNSEPRRILHRELYTEQGADIYEDDALIASAQTEGIPAAWIRNSSIMGESFGISDLEDVANLTEEYDHVCSKRTREIDYYSSPHLVLKGVTKGSMETVELNTGTVLFIPENADASFLEWGGNQPDVETHLHRIRNSISEISQVPPVAFGQMDSTGADLSGVALEVLFRPLSAKTQEKQANWGPEMERLMSICLLATEQRFTIEADRISAVWGSSLPVNLKELVETESLKVTSQFSSRRTAMNKTGIKEPGAEFRRMMTEERILRLLNPPAVPEGVAEATVPAAQDEEAPPGVQPAAPLPPPDPADLSAQNLEELERQFADLEAILAAEDEIERREEND